MYYMPDIIKKIKTYNIHNSSPLGLRPSVNISYNYTTLKVACLSTV